MKNTNNTQTDVAPGQLVAGQMLAQQREKLGLDIAECAEALKISVYKVKALESGDEAPFTSDIFIRGYLRNYAKLVNLSEEEILHVYLSQKQVDQVKEERIARTNRPAKSKWWMPYVIGIIIILGWFIVSNSLVYQQDGSNQEASVSLLESVKSLQERLMGEENIESTNIDSSEQVDVTEGPDGRLEPAPNVAIGTTDNNLDVQSSASDNVAHPLEQYQQPPQDVLQETIVDNQEAIDSIVVDRSVETQVTGSDIQANEDIQVAVNAANLENDVQQSITSNVDDTPVDLVDTTESNLFFTFSEACWVEVVDANNQTVVSDLQKANTELLLKGVAPFSIILGNVNGTTLHFNGEQVPLVSSADGRTLRLTLGE